MERPQPKIRVDDCVILNAETNEKILEELLEERHELIAAATNEKVVVDRVSKPILIIQRTRRRMDYDDNLFYQELVRLKPNDANAYHPGQMEMIESWFRCDHIQTVQFYKIVERKPMK